MWGKLSKWASAIKGKSSEFFGWFSRIGTKKKVNPIFETQSETPEEKLDRMDSDRTVNTYIPSNEIDAEEMQREREILSSGSGDEIDTDDEINMVNYNEEVDEEFISRRSSQLDSIALGDEDHAEYPPIFKLNSDCRRKIYEFLPLKDVPNVRLVCRFLKEDVDQLKGVRVTLNDDTYKIDLELISTLGIRYLTIRKLVSNSLEGVQLKYPTILCDLSITGPISEANYLFLMESCLNIKRFSIELKSPSIHVIHQHLSELCYFKDISEYPKKLRVFRIAPTCLDIDHLNELSEDYFAILDRIKSNHLHRFIFQGLFSMTPPNLNDFHLSCVKFIKYHAHSLKSMIINVKLLNPIEDFEFEEGRFVLGPSERTNDVNANTGSNSSYVIEDVRNWAMLVKLKDFRLRTDYFFRTMYLPLLESQTGLEKLDLHVKNLNWNLICPIISRCCRTLKSLRVGNLYFTTIDNINRNNSNVIHQIDLLAVAGCEQLETLSLVHQENPRIVNCQLTNWSQLPISITKLSFNKIRVSPRQIFGMIKILKNLVRLDLILWSHDEESFLTFFNHLPYFMAKNFIKDPQESIPNLNLINLFEHRTRFEKYSKTISKCKSELKNILDVTFHEIFIQQTHLELSIEIHLKTTSGGYAEDSTVASSTWGLEAE